METIPCDLCGGTEHQPYQDVVDRYSGESFQLVECRQCGLIFLNPRPSAAEIGRYYPDTYEPHQQSAAAGSMFSWHMRRMRQFQLDFLQQFLSPPGRLLDLGCATGEFLLVARDGGWTVSGVEMMPLAAAVARDTHQLNVAVSSAEDANLEPETYDVITMWDVLEHLQSPQTVLEKCRRALKPGGWLIFAIPNLKSFDRQLFGPAWLGWEAPRHLFFFTPRTLQQLLSRNGLTLQHGACIGGGRGVFEISMETRWGNHPAWGAIDKAMPLIQTALWPYRKISYVMKRGTIITYAAQKTAESA